MSLPAAGAPEMVAQRISVRLCFLLAGEQIFGLDRQHRPVFRHNGRTFFMLIKSIPAPLHVRVLWELVWRWYGLGTDIPGE